MAYIEPQRVVLKQYKDSFLIVKIRPDNTVHEYVVCRNWDGNSWDWGHYFQTIDDALQYFNEDRMGGEESKIKTLRAWGAWFDGKYNANMSSIYGELIKEAAKCNSYCSDILYDIYEIETILSERGLSETRLIGFRKHGTDSDTFIEMRLESYELSAIYRSMAKIDFIKEGDEIKVKLSMTTDCEVMALWADEHLNIGGK